MIESIDEFRLAMEKEGIMPPTQIIPDGKVHRFSSDGRPGKLSGWYKFQESPIASGAFGCWRRGITCSWYAKGRPTMTKTEREPARIQTDALRAADEEERRRVNERAKQRADQEWREAERCKEHPYLTAKGVMAHGLREDADGHLLVPMRDTYGTLWNFERIKLEDFSDKRGLRGGRRTGCFHKIGDEPEGTVIVCEGYATGASIHAATGKFVAVAFNAGNLMPVAKALRSRFPDITIILAADDDCHAQDNVGIAKATEAARMVGGLLAVPVFGDSRPNGATDFNDLFAFAGARAVRDCVDAAEAPGPDASQASEGQGDGVVLTNGSDVTIEPVNWLWNQWLAQGKLHILAGAPGQGKTTIAMSMAATVSSGGRWPDGSACSPGNVLIWSGEDDIADTLLPRLLAAGADRSKCYFVEGTRIDGVLQPFDPSRDMPRLESKARDIGNVRLVIVDPVVSAVKGDSHKNAEVRRALQPLVDLASKLGCACLGITHFSKGGAGTEPMQRIIGSVAFAAVARVVLVAGSAASNGGQDVRVLARCKSNIGSQDGGIQYQIEHAEQAGGIHTSRVAWGISVSGTARELLVEADSARGVEGEVVELLRNELESGELRSATEINAAMLASGYSGKQVWAASKKLGVVRKKTSMRGGWSWQLPPNGGEVAPANSEDSHVRSMESSESSTRRRRAAIVNSFPGPPRSGVARRKLLTD